MGALREGLIGPTGIARRIANSPLRTAAAVVFVTAGALYLRTIGHGFVWDDLSILMTNDALSDGSRLVANLAPGFFFETSGPPLTDYWRPVVVLSHMVDRALFGDAPWGPHLINALLHAVTSVLVFLLGQAWCGRVRWALAAGLVFAVHPVHVEVVAWVSGRSDLLSGLFLALALWADARHGRTGRPRWQALSLGSFALALLSKEAAIIFPVLILARILLAPEPWGPGQRSPRKVVAALGPVLGVVFVLLWARFGLFAGAAPQGLHSPTGRATLFWTWWSAFLLYLKLLVWPAKLTILHHLDLARSFWTPRVVAGSLAFVSLGWWCWRARRRAAGAAFGITAMILCLAPLSNFLVPVSHQGGMEFPVAERFLYAPSIGFSLFAGWVLAIWLPRLLGGPAIPYGTRGAVSVPTSGKVADRAALVAGGLTLLALLALGVRSDRRVRDWYSDATLFGAAVAESPGSYLAHLNYAAARAAAADSATEPKTARALLDSARHHYLEAARLAPDNFRVHYDLANLYRSAGLAEQATVSYRRALELNPDLYQAHVNLGALLARNGDLEGALEHFAAADRLAPQLAASKVNRAHVLQMLGRTQEAIALYEEALALEPALGAALDGLRRARNAAPSGPAD